MKSKELTGQKLALKFACKPPMRGSLTLSSEGYRAALSLLMPALNQLLTKEDAFILQSLTKGNAVLLTHLLMVGDEIYLPSKLNPGQMKKIKCWGGGRKEMGLLKLRSAGFEKQLKFDEIPEKITYGYSKSVIAPPEQFDVKEIAKSFKGPKASLQRKLVCGFRGDWICKVRIY